MAFIKRNILAGWSKAGLFPFNPDRVLKDISNPHINIMKYDDIQESPNPYKSPMRSPVTPVSTAGFTLLQKLIVERDAETLDVTSKENLQRYLHKLVKAAQISSAKGNL